MALLILCDPHYRNSHWCETKLRGIYDEASRRRIPVKLFTDTALFVNAAAKLGSDSSVIILFNSFVYLEEVSALLAPLAIHPILSVTESEIKFSRIYSQVCGDVDTATKELVEFLHKNGKRRIALLGSSEKSAAGKNKEHMLYRHADAENFAVFHDKGNLLQSFKDFLAEKDSFDAVVCTNDHQTIALIEFLQAMGAYDPSLYIVSHGDTFLSRLYGDGVSTISTSFYACGKSLVEAHMLRLKYSWSSVMIRVPCEFKKRGSTSGNAVYPPVDFVPEYANQIVLGRLESLLASSDMINLKLIYGLMSNYSYERMSDLCFLSAGAIKYRIQRIRETLKCKSREDAVACISRYIQKEKLLELIEKAEDFSGKVIHD